MNERKDLSQARNGEVVSAAAGSGDLAGDGHNGLYADVSREMVHLYKEQFGRGPTKARTTFAGADCLICTLENSFTPAERRLVEMGEQQRLRDTRLFFQHATEPEFCEVIERLTQRTVRAFVSGTDVSKDVSSEVFYFEPRGGAKAPEAIPPPEG